MNQTPAPHQTPPQPLPEPPPQRTASDVASAPASAPTSAPASEGAAPRTEAEAEAEAEAERAALEAKMALLPDYDDEAFPGRSSRRPRAPGRPGAGEAGEGSGGVAEAGAQDEPSPVPIVLGGFLGGALANMGLGFVLLGAQRAGAALDGPGVLAVVVAVVILALMLGSWPRRVWLGAGGFLLGLLLSFAALFLFVRPLLLDSATSTRAPIAAPDAPADSSGSPS